MILQPTGLNPTWKLEKYSFGQLLSVAEKHLLADDLCKTVITDNLTNLSERGLADLYAFVIHW